MLEITEHLLIKLAGQAAYDRGVRYFTEGRVTQIEAGDRQTSATVEGSQPYSVRLKHTSRQLDGSCDCPASQGFDFCKHCVAVALALQDRAAASSVLETGSDTEKLKAYLSLQSQDFLTAELFRASQQLPALREKLLLQAELATGKDPARRLKKAVTSVTRPRHIWDYRQVAAYFAHAEATLQNIVAVSADIPPDVLLKTAVYAMERVDKALEHIDDSGGHRFGTYRLLQQLHTVALGRIEWAVDRKANHLLDLALALDSDQLNDLPESYADALRADGLAAFYANVESRLNALPALPYGSEFQQKLPYLRLTSFLEQRAAESEDWDTLIALEEKTATSERDYRRIALLCLRNSNTDSAIDWNQQADALDGGHGADSASVWCEIHAARREWDAALEAQRRVISSQPEYEQFTRLFDLALQADRAEEVRNEAIAWLRKNPGNLQWQAAQRAFTLAQILRDGGDFRGAYAAIVERVDDPERLQRAAGWLEAQEPALARDLYGRAVTRLIAATNRRSYQAAVELLERTRSCFDAVGPTEFTNFVTQIRNANKARKSLIAVLDRLTG